MKLDALSAWVLFSDTFVGETMCRLQTMDGIFNLQRPTQPEQIADGVQVELLLTAQIDISAAAASRSLLHSVKLLLNDHA